MSTTTAKPDPSRVQPGKKYRLTADTAEEAVQTIRRRLGENARVISVKQVEGKGLGRFLRAPRLEIVAETGGPDKPFEVKETPAPAAKPEAILPPVDEPEAPVKARRIETADPGTERAEPEEPPVEMEFPNLERRRPREEDRNRCTDWAGLLRRAGFDGGMVARWESLPLSQRWSNLPIAVALTEVASLLKHEAGRLPEREVTSRIAFLGTPGAGKTTSVGKQLVAHAVNDDDPVPVCVAQMEGEDAHASDMLHTFCEVTGSELMQEPFDFEDADGDAVFLFDLPGMTVRDRDAWEQAAHRLDHIGVDTRALVLHAAYDRSLQQALIERARETGATHLVLTHLDEIDQTGRLWPIVLQSGLTPLFLCESSAFAADHVEDVVGYLLERSFPRGLVDGAVR